MMRHQLFQDDALLRRVTALQDGGQIGIHGRAMQYLQSVFQRRQLILPAHIGGQQFPQFQLVIAQQSQRLVGELQPAVLLDAADARIDRRQ